LSVENGNENGMKREEKIHKKFKILTLLIN